MKTVIKIIAVIAIVIGIMAIFAGSSVLLGIFNPGYQHYNTLIIYNVIIGIASIITGILIWKKNEKAFLFSLIITILHISVLLLLISIFSNIIANQSIHAMMFRSIVWLIITLVIWKVNIKSN